MKAKAAYFNFDVPYVKQEGLKCNSFLDLNYTYAEVPQVVESLPGFLHV